MMWIWLSLYFGPMVVIWLGVAWMYFRKPDTSTNALARGLLLSLLPAFNWITMVGLLQDALLPPLVAYLDRKRPTDKG